MRLTFITWRQMAEAHLRKRWGKSMPEDLPLEKWWQKGVDPVVAAEVVGAGDAWVMSK